MNGETQLAKTLAQIKARRRTRPPDCLLPDAPADLPTTHSLMLTSIDARLTKLEGAMTNQNRLLLIGILAIVGDIVKHYL